MPPSGILPCAVISLSRCEKCKRNCASGRPRGPNLFALHNRAAACTRRGSAATASAGPKMDGKAGKAARRETVNARHSYVRMTSVRRVPGDVRSAVRRLRHRRERAMRRMLLALALLPALLAFAFSAAAFAGDAEIQAAQTDHRLAAEGLHRRRQRHRLQLCRAQRETDLPDARQLHEHGDRRLQAGAEAAELFFRQGGGDEPRPRSSSRSCSSVPTARTTRRSTRSSCSPTACTASPASACAHRSR